MDGASDSPLSISALLVVDFAERLVCCGLLPLAFLGVVFSLYALLGCWSDILLVAGLFWLPSIPALATWISDAEATRHVLPVLPGLGLVILTMKLLWPRRTSHTWEPFPGPGRPYLIPCRTTHRRKFPKKHSFSYSYLVVGVPVGFRGTVNGLIAVDGPGRSRACQDAQRGPRGWFEVNARDYLQRGHGELGLRGKLDNYLKAQGADPSDYPFAYLVTAARFLEYHFNPVSFWYLYSSTRVLSAVVLEVNNTFGERRSCLVRRDFAGEAKLEDGNNSTNVGAASSRVKGSWQNDVYVSPFNFRKGSYSLRANDPLGPDMQGFRGLDVTINLSSSGGHPKIIARLFSEGEAADPSLMSGLRKLRFLVGSGSDS